MTRRAQHAIVSILDWIKFSQLFLAGLMLLIITTSQPDTAHAQAARFTGIQKTVGGTGLIYPEGVAVDSDLPPKTAQM